MGIGRNCFAVSAAETRCVAAILHGPDTAPDHVAHHRHAPVGGGEVFETVAGDPAMDADLRVMITRDTLPVLVSPAGVLPETCTPPRFLSLERSVEADLHRVGIVERNR